MLNYIFRRTLMIIPVVLGITFIIFGILEVSPGDPVRMILQNTATEEDIARRREELGLNDPFLVRYGRFVAGAVQGDFGRHFRSNIPIAGLIAARIPVTLKLAFFGILITLVLGIPVGVISATKQYSALDDTSRFFSMLFSAVPNFWLGLMLILLFSVQLNLLPSFGVAKGLKSYILPAIALAASYTANLVRVTRSTMLEVVRQDYIRTARAKGATESQITRKHAIKNALMPVITIAGVFFGRMLGGSVIIEAVFALPGLGSFILDGIKTKDIPTVLGGVTVLAISFSLINLLVDLLYALIDPRIKAKYQSMYARKKPKRKLIREEVGA